MGSNQPQIHDSLNTRNIEQTATIKKEEKKNIYYQIPLKVYQDKKEIPRRGMMWKTTHYYPVSIEYEDISIALNEVDSWIDLLNAHAVSYPEGFSYWYTSMGTNEIYLYLHNYFASQATSFFLLSLNKVNF